MNIIPLILIPAFNEGLNIKSVLEAICDYDVLVVDDGSTDETQSCAKSLGYKVISHERNYGVGKAIISGVKYAKEMGYSHIVTLDADGQHDPYYLNQFIDMLNFKDFVIGDRFLEIDSVPSQKLTSNFFASLIIEELTNVFLRDVACGYRAFKIEDVNCESDCLGFDFLYEQMVCSLNKRTRIGRINIPALYDERTLLYTKQTELRDLIKVAYQRAGDNNFAMSILHIFSKINLKEDFYLLIKGVKFYGYFLKNHNGYIIQTNIDTARQHYL